MLDSSRFPVNTLLSDFSGHSDPLPSVSFPAMRAGLVVDVMPGECIILHAARAYTL